MKNKIIHLALAAAMQSIQNTPKLSTTGFMALAGRSTGKIKSSGQKWFRKSKSKYEPHQGKQECARRLRRGSPAWYSAATFAK